MIDAYSKKIKINGSYLSMKCVSLILGINKATKKYVQESFSCFVDLKNAVEFHVLEHILGNNKFSYFLLYQEFKDKKFG